MSFLHTIVLKDFTDSKHYILDNTVYEQVSRVNGDRYTVFKIFDSVNNKNPISEIDKRWMIDIYRNNKFERFIVQNIYETFTNGILTLEVDSLQVDYDNLKREVLLERHSGSKTMEEWFKFAFKGSSYNLILRTEFQKARTIESFGWDSRLSLLLRLCETFGVELYIEGKNVFVVDKIGDYKDDYVEYGMNLKNISRNRVMEGFGTRVTMFGKPYEDDKGNVVGHFKVDYTHPMSSVYGIIDIPPISDERFSDKSSMLERCKQEIEDSWNLSMSVEISELTFKSDGMDIYEGDFIRIFDHRLDFDSIIRIVEKRVLYDIDGDVIETILQVGDYDEDYANHLKQINEIKELYYLSQTNKDITTWTQSQLEALSKLTDEQIKNLGELTEEQLRELGTLTEEQIRELSELTDEQIKDLSEKTEREIKDMTDWATGEFEKTNSKLDKVQEQAGRAGNIYRQATEPKGNKDIPLKHGDIWYKTLWAGSENKTQVEMYQFELEGGIGKWRRVEDIEMGNADRLEKGTINAKVINLINLNANEIVSGYISSERIKASSITSDKLNVKTLSAISANLGHIKAGTIESVSLKSSTIEGTTIRGGWFKPLSDLIFPEDVAPGYRGYRTTTNTMTTHGVFSMTEVTHAQNDTLESIFMFSMTRDGILAEKWLDYDNTTVCMKIASPMNEGYSVMVFNEEVKYHGKPKYYEHCQNPDKKPRDVLLK